MRVVAAEALGLLGETEAALRALAAVLANGNLYEALAAQNALDGLWQAGHIELAAALESVRGRSFPEPGDRIPRYWLEQARQRSGAIPVQPTFRVSLPSAVWQPQRR